MFTVRVREIADLVLAFNTDKSKNQQNKKFKSKIPPLLTFRPWLAKFYKLKFHKASHVRVFQLKGYWLASLVLHVVCHSTVNADHI